MNIIFGDAIKEIPDSFTILELDTFRATDNQLQTAYCVVETIPLSEFATLEDYKKIHADLVKYYHEQQWNYCEHAIEGLMGHWNGELDTFYTSLLSRVMHFKENPPADDWDGIIVKK
jgi:hypothetical protein